MPSLASRDNLFSKPSSESGEGDDSLRSVAFKSHDKNWALPCEEDGRRCLEF